MLESFLDLRSWFADIFVFATVCARPLSLAKAFLPLLPTRLLYLVVMIPLVC